VHTTSQDGQMSSSSALEAASYGGARVDIGGPVDL